MTLRLSWLLAGLCSSMSLACSGVAGTTDACEALDLSPAGRCMSYHVTGDFGLVDNLQVDVLYQDQSTSQAPYHIRRITSTPLGGAAVEPPLTFAIALGPDSVPSKIRVVARLGSTPVAYGTSGLQVGRTERRSSELVLDDVLASTCFDGKLNGSELDVDCEGDSAFEACPFCVVGQRCTDDLSCVDSVCNRAAGAQVGLCKAVP